MNGASDERSASRTSTGLIVLAQDRALGPAARPRPLAGFVTQLLACAGQLPAYRARRRAEPDVALASYGGGDAAPRAPRFERVF